MSALQSTSIRAAIVAATLAAAGGAHAASFSVTIPPWGTSTYSFPQCNSFSWNGTTLACVTSGSTPPTPGPTPPTPGSGVPFEGCPGDALKIDNQWGSNAIATHLFGYFGGNILSVRVAVPANATGSKAKSTSWVEYGAGPVVREGTFSTRACDFSEANALPTASGARATTVGQDRLNVTFQYTFGSPTNYAVKLVPGSVYYINIRNRYSDGSLTCSIDNCSMRGSLPQ